MEKRKSITRLLSQLADGDSTAFDRVVEMVYDDLRAIAHRYIERRGGMITLNTTALVHEAYLRLVDRDHLQWKDRDHFLAVYSVVMRNLLVDMARRRRAVKHGGDRTRVVLDDHNACMDYQADHILAVNDALEKLATMDPRLAHVVECRFFAGLSEGETASALGVSERTVQRDWFKAKAILGEWMSTD